MALREFTDPSGTFWRVYDIVPVERARTHVPADVGKGRGRANLLPQEMRAGWLCFESGGEKRRLIPPEPGWEVCADVELWVLCQRAETVQERER